AGTGRSGPGRAPPGRHGPPGGQSDAAGTEHHPAGSRLLASVSPGRRIGGRWAGTAADGATARGTHMNRTIMGRAAPAQLSDLLASVFLAEFLRPSSRLFLHAPW